MRLAASKRRAGNRRRPQIAAHNVAKRQRACCSGHPTSAQATRAASRPRETALGTKSLAYFKENDDDFYSALFVWSFFGRILFLKKKTCLTALADFLA